MSSQQFDVIVIGAGFSGLTAAYTVKKKYPDASLILLEANDRYGGRTQTASLAAASGKDMWDVGGQWVGKSQTHIMKLIGELGIETYRQYTDGKSVLQIGGTRVKSYSGTIPSLPILSLLDLFWTMWKYDSLQKQVDANDPFSHPKAKEWDSISLRHHMETTMYTQDAKEVIDATMRTVFGAEPEQISFLYFLMYIKQAGNLENIIEDKEGTAQESKIKGGTDRILKALLLAIGSQNLKLNEPVRSITQTEHGVNVVTSSGWTGVATRVILAMPPKAIDTIDFFPLLSRDRVDFSRRMPMGNYIKVIITYERAFWRAKGLRGLAVCAGYPMPGDAMPAPFSIVYDGTSSNDNPALVGFVGGKIAVEFSMRPAVERKKAALAHMACLYGEEALGYLDYVEKDWSREPFCFGAPVSVISVGAMENYGRAIRREEGRIHFAGTETATSWTGYISGAVQAGERAALEVLSHIQPKTLTHQDRLLLEEKDRVQARLSSRGKVGKGRSSWRVFTVSVCVAAASVFAFAVYSYFNDEIGKLIVLK